MIVLFNLPIAWASIVGLAVFAFVLLDGYDLLIGTLLSTSRRHAARTRTADSLAGSSRRRTQSRLRRLSERHSQEAADGS